MKRSIKIILCAAAIALALSAGALRTGCGGARGKASEGINGAAAPEKKAPVSEEGFHFIPGRPALRVILSAGARVLLPGDEFCLTVRARPAPAEDLSVEWTSSDALVASVDAGRVRARSAGRAVITARTAEGAASCAVTVVEDPAEDLPGDDSLCLAVLGYQLNTDGSMREELLGRLRVALRIAQKYPRSVIVCTGGPTARGDPEATEAGKMAQWLVRMGVESARVLAEDRSLTTRENAVYTLELLRRERPQTSRIVIITSDYHMASGVRYFSEEVSRAGGEITVTSGAAWPARPSSASPSPAPSPAPPQDTAGKP